MNRSHRYHYRGRKNISVTSLPLQKHKNFCRLPLLTVNNSNALLTFLYLYHTRLLLKVDTSYEYPPLRQNFWSITSEKSLN